MVKFRVAGLALLAFTSAQSSANNSSRIAFPRPVPQAITELTQPGQSVQTTQDTNEQSTPLNTTSKPPTSAWNADALVNISRIKTVNSASLTYIPTFTSSWPSSSSEPATTPDASFTHAPTHTDEGNFTHLPTTTIEESSFAYALSTTDSVVLPAANTADVPSSFTSTSTAEQTAVTTVQRDVELSSSAITFDSSYMLETVQTMQTQAELVVPTSNTPIWTSTTSLAAMSTPVIYAPHVEHQASSLHPAVAVPVVVNANPPVAQQEQSATEYNSSSRNVPASNTPPYHESTQALPTTLLTASSSAPMTSETQTPVIQTAQSVPSKIKSMTSSGVSTAETLTKESLNTVLQITASAAVPTVHALTYQGQTVQMSGMTLAAEPTASGLGPGDSVENSAGLVDNAAVLAYRKPGLLLLMALAMTVGAWVTV